MNEPTESRAGAAKLLDLPAEATPAEARSAFLKRLESVDFAPSDDLRAGLGTLDERLAVAPCAATTVNNVRRDMLSVNLDEFSRDFWALPPADRKERWQSLWDRCEKQPALVKHLQHLEPGLDLTGSEAFPLTDRSARIAELIKQTYPLRRLERTVCRQEWLSENSSQPEMWKQAANRLCATAPALAALDPDLIGEIRKRPDRPKIYTQRNSNGWPAFLIIGGFFGLTAISLPHSDKKLDPPASYDYQYQDRSPTYAPSPAKGQDAASAALVESLTRRKVFDLKLPQLQKSKTELLPQPREVKSDSFPHTMSTQAPGDRP